MRVNATRAFRAHILVAVQVLSDTRVCSLKMPRKKETPAYVGHINRFEFSLIKITGKSIIKINQS